MATKKSNAVDIGAQLDRIEAMLQILLERVPNGNFAWSQSEQHVELRAMKNRERRAQHEADLREQQEAAAAWQIPRARRESLLLKVVGDERLTIREMAERLNAELGFPSLENQHHAVYESHVKSLVGRMFRAGLLARAEESFQNKPRNRYFRPLAGPIVELERAFNNHDQEAGA